MGILDGKAIVITGSGRGIGAACARQCAQQGAAVIVNDIDATDTHATTAAITAAGGRAVACVADVSDSDQAGRLIESCLSAFGRIDGLVNNAALYDRAAVDAFDPAEARRLVATNVLGPIYCIGHAVRPMKSQRCGSIVNLISGAHLGMPLLGVYGATKGAVASMVYTWALELEDSGVRINGFSPFAGTRIGIKDRRGPIPAEAAARLAQMPSPEANTPVVEFLLSDLSCHVTGQLVRLDKGELQLYTHPALLLPSVTRDTWTAQSIAQVFDAELRARLIPSGMLGTTHLPVELPSGPRKRPAPG